MEGKEGRKKGGRDRVRESEPKVELKTIKQRLCENCEACTGVSIRVYLERNENKNNNFII